MNFATIAADHTRADWDRAIRDYSLIAERNARARVKRMSMDDLRQYAAAYNTPSDDPEAVLAHMQRWCGPHELMTSGALVRGTSQLFNRLLSGQSALPYPPPRTHHNQPWFALFESSQPLRVTVAYGGKSRRSRDGGAHIWLLILNDCPYEFSAADQTDSVHDWLMLNTPINIAGHQLKVRYGEWPEPFQLSIQSTGSQPVIAHNIECVADVIRTFDLNCEISYPLIESAN